MVARAQREHSAWLDHPVSGGVGMRAREAEGSLDLEGAVVLELGAEG
jgi:hypothetical protein